MEHTKLDLFAHGKDGLQIMEDNGQVPVAVMSTANADPVKAGRRLIAAANACAGIPTEALEAGVVSELTEALKLCVDALGWIYNRDSKYAEACDAGKAALAATEARS